MMSSSTCKDDNLKLNVKPKKCPRYYDLNIRANKRAKTYVTSIKSNIITAVAAAATTTTTTTAITATTVAPITATATVTATTIATSTAITVAPILTTKWNNLNSMSPKDTDSHVILGNPGKLVNSTVIIATATTAAINPIATITVTTPTITSTTIEDITTLPTIECMSTKHSKIETATMPKASITMHNLIGKMINDVSKYESNNPIRQQATVTAPSTTSTIVIPATTATTTTTTATTAATTREILSKAINVGSCVDGGILPVDICEFPTSTLTAAIDDSKIANRNLKIVEALERTSTVQPPASLEAKIEGDITLLPSSLSLLTLSSSSSRSSRSSSPSLSLPLPLSSKHVNKLIPSRITTTATATATTITPATETPTTTTNTTALYCLEQSVLARTLPTLAITKSKSTENKCPSEVLTKVSNQKELGACSTNLYLPYDNLSAEYTIHKQLISPTTTLSTHRCELLESGAIPKGLQSTSNAVIKDTSIFSNRSISLADKKAKLKSDFFSEFNSNKHLKNSTGYPFTESSQGITIHINLPSASPSPSLSKRRNIQNLQLKISKTDQNNTQIENYFATSPTQLTTTAATTTTTTVLPCIEVHVIDTTNTTDIINEHSSLVAQRKLDLECKFRQQISIKASTAKTTVTSNRNLFPSVEQLLQKFGTRGSIKMIVNPNQLTPTNDNNMLSLKSDAYEQRHSPLSDEGCNLGQSPYSSDNEDNESIRTTSTTIERSKRKDKVARSASSDSALGLDVDDPMDANVPAALPPAEQTQKRRMTLTVTDLPLRPALLPLAEPTTLPDSPTTELQHSLQNVLDKTTVPSKVLLEERVVEIPEDPRSLGCSLSSSRRESAQSCISDYPTSEMGGVRFVRTPSVVVSDYSDDVMIGITLEEIEYFRAHRMRRRRSSLETAGNEKDADANSDVSASSSCSNLYYCGSTISALDGAECYVNGIRMPLERKISDCSTCSASGGEDDTSFTIPEQPEEDNIQQKEKDLADMLAAQHLGPKRQKKF
ncbi:mucin-5AC-like [Teleopsis dalmanni]|uniref:mucin-5AC-like n=1 Tax=Teleopsis dalmanni TaxID=139649 RepID=UPI0018CD28A4|nr:mucin-5AC-like [Teleopsis dalmanni]